MRGHRASSKILSPPAATQRPPQVPVQAIGQRPQQPVGDAEELVPAVAGVPVEAEAHRALPPALPPPPTVDAGSPVRVEAARQPPSTEPAQAMMFLALVLQTARRDRLDEVFRAWQL